MRTLLLAIAILLSFASSSFAAEDAVDRVAIAARLVADGLYDRAASVLEEYGEPEADAEDRSRFFSLRGMTNLNLGMYDAAAADLREALKDPEVDPLLNLYLAQALLAMDDANGALEALNNAATQPMRSPARGPAAKLRKPWGRCKRLGTPSGRDENGSPHIQGSASNSSC